MRIAGSKMKKKNFRICLHKTINIILCGNNDRITRCFENFIFIMKDYHRTFEFFGSNESFNKKIFIFKRA